MPLRSIVATPEELSRIVSAFEDAWRLIEARGKPDPLSRAAERERLGYIVAGLWNAQAAGDLTELAIQHFDAMAAGVPAPLQGTKPPDRSA